MVTAICRHLIFSLVLFLLPACSLPGIPHQQPIAQKGVIDLRAWGFESRGPVQLNGEWEFYWQRLLDPAELSAERLDPAFLIVPGSWSAFSPSGGDGFATYRLRILIDPALSELAIKVADIETAYKLYIDGIPTGSVGIIGTSREQMVPAWKPEVYSFRPNSGEVELVLQMSNFYHRKGGISEPIQFGPADRVIANQNMALFFAAFLIGGLFLISIYHFGIFTLRPSIRPALYFAILCSLLALRISASEEYLIVSIFPDLPWIALIRLNYLSIALILPLFTMFIHSIFPDDYSKWMVYFSQVAGLGYGILILFTPPDIFTYGLPLFELLIILVGIYICFVMAQIVHHHRQGGLVFLIGLSFLIVTIINDVLVNNLLISTPYLTPIGIFVFIFIQSFLLARRVATAFERSEVVSAELERRVEERMQDLARSHQELILTKTGLEEEIIKRRMVEADLVKSKEKAEAANRAKSSFLANMSHELRTPLNAILGFAQLLRREKNLSHEQRENLEIIIRSGDHLLSLINDVLEFSKIEAGRVVVQPNAFDLQYMLNDLANIFRLRAEDKDLKLNLEFHPDLPRYIAADEGKLRQILINLLSNALKFTVEGKITLRAWTIDSKQQSASGLHLVDLHIEVEDTGPGIPLDEQGRIFEPFLQAGGRPNNTEGTGLGLTISHQFVQLMRGKIDFRSQSGIGSLFWFEIPVAITQAAQIEKPKVNRRVIGIAPGQPVFRLLVAEDNASNRRLLVKLLEPLGFEVREVSDGEQAVAVWKEWQPHLVWMDVRMPIIDGRAATEQIKKLSRMKGLNTLVIAISASAFEEDRIEMLAAGCDDFVRKPFRESQIFNVLEQHLGIRFLYSDERTTPIQTASPKRTGRNPRDSSLAALAQMPTEWLNELRNAAMVGDINWMAALIQASRESNPPLNSHLSGLASEFRYDEILNLVNIALQNGK